MTVTVIDRPFIIDTLKMDKLMWLTSVHICILNDNHINGNSGGPKVIDQSASRSIDDVISSTSEVSRSEVKMEVDKSW